MTDIAQILGVSDHGRAVAAAAVPAPPPPPPPQVHRAAQKVQRASLSREVMHLLSAGDYHTVGGGAGGGADGSAPTTSSSGLAGMGLPPAVPTFTSSSDILGDGTAGDNNKDPKQVKVGAKWIRTDKPARKWAWAPFTSSARTDGALFCHWVRAGVEYPDYPYSRFDVHLDPVTYTDDEYKRHLVSDEWTRGETDALMELARILELRWAVIHDRWIERQPPPGRTVEELQHRYYYVAAKVGQLRISNEAAQEVQALVSATPTTLSAADDASKIIATENLLVEAAAARALASADGSNQPLMANVGTGSTNKVFDLDAERERRAHLNALWNRSKDDEAEEFEIRKELKQVEAQLRKLKKAGVHIMAAAKAASAAASGAASSAGGASAAAGAPPGGGPASFATGAALSASAAPSAASSRNPSRAASPANAATLIDTASSAVDHALNSTAPVPTARTPYLQSGRLSPPNAGGGGGGGGGAALSGAAAAGINKALLARMDAVLAELRVDVAALVPTKRACDLYDAVRRDILTLLILQKNLFQKEAMLEGKRLKLSKMGGSVAAAGSASAAVLDEEALMGIVPPQPAPPPPAASATGGSPSRGPTGGAPGAAANAAGKAKGGSGGKQPKPSGGGGKAKSAAAAGSKAKAGGPSDGAAVGSGAAKKGKELKDDGKPKKAAVKRKRNKSDASTAGATAKMPPPSAGAGSAEANTDASTTGAVASSAAAPVAPPPSSGAVVPRKSDDGKPAKKRAKKAAPPAP